MNVKHFVLSIHLLCATSIFGYTKPDTYTVMGETYQVLKSSHGFLEEGLPHGTAKSFMAITPRMGPSLTCISCQWHIKRYPWGHG